MRGHTTFLQTSPMFVLKVLETNQKLLVLGFVVFFFFYYHYFTTFFVFVVGWFLFLIG